MAMPAARLARPPTRETPVDRLRDALSPAALLDGLQRYWPDVAGDGGKLVSCEPLRVHPRGAGAFNIEYALRLDTNSGKQSRRLFGEIADDDAQTRYQQAIRRLSKPRRGQLSASNAAERIGCVPALGLVLRTPGLDERLHGLKLFHQLPLASSVLSQYRACDVESVADVSAELLGHRLGKRCIVRFSLTAPDASSRSLIAKTYKLHADRGAANAAVMRQLREQGFGASSDLATPEPIGHLADWQTLLMEDIGGTPIAELPDEAWATGVNAAGRLLAKLHRCPIRVAASHGIDDEIALIERGVNFVSSIEPDKQPRLTNALARVTAALRHSSPRERALVHRDFYDKQVLIAGDRAVLIDFDTICLSTPALDIGNFIAHLRFEGPLDADRLEHDFLAGYGSVPCERDIDAYVNSTLLRLCCIHAFSERRRSQVERVLETL